MAEQQLTGRLLAAGRALAGVSHADLATASGNGPVSRSEWRRRVPGAHAAALLAALETFGIVIIREGDGMGAGVRLKFTFQRKAGAIRSA